MNHFAFVLNTGTKVIVMAFFGRDASHMLLRLGSHVANISICPRKLPLRLHTAWNLFREMLDTAELDIASL